MLAPSSTRLQIEEGVMAPVTDTTENPPETRPCILCELDASTQAEELLGDAIAMCEEHGAELYVVWVLEPGIFGSPFSVSPGAAGAFGLPHVLRSAIERARERGIPATSAVRIGEREVVLRREAQSTRADSIFRLDGAMSRSTAKDTEIVRCPHCGWRLDARAVHLCPKVHLDKTPRHVTALTD
jgi:hypothetical protein